MVITYTLEKSNRSGKRFVIEMDDNMKHHFGSNVGKTYIDGRTDTYKKNWIARHQVNKNWNNKHSGIYYSRHLLWGKYKSLQKNIDELEKKDNIKIINKIN